MNLQDIYTQEGIRGLEALAQKAECNPKYLWQIATGRRTPRPAMATRLIEADSRIKWADLYASKSASSCEAA